MLLPLLVQCREAGPSGRRPWRPPSWTSTVASPICFSSTRPGSGSRADSRWQLACIKPSNLLHSRTWTKMSLVATFSGLSRRMSGPCPGKALDTHRQASESDREKEEALFVHARSRCMSQGQWYLRYPTSLSRHPYARVPDPGPL